MIRVGTAAFVLETSILSEEFVTQFAGHRRPWLRGASSEYSRYAVVGPPCQDRRWLADLCNELLGKDTSMQTAKRHLLAAMALICVLGVPLTFSREWVPLDQPSASPAAIQVHTLHVTPTTLEAEIRVPGLWTYEDTLDGRDFARLTLDGGDLLARIGRPALPVIRRRIAVPRGAQVRWRLVGDREREWTLASLGLPPLLLPIQPPVPKIEGADEDRSVVIDEALYRSDRFWPQADAAIAGRGVVRGQDVVLIELRPVRINPAQGVLRIWSQARLVIETTGGDPCNPPLNKGPGGDDPFLGEILGAERPPSPLCQGPLAPLAAAGQGSTGGAEGMLVIVADDLAGAIDPLVDWKRKTGFKVEVVKLSELGPSPTDQDVKDRIQQAYDSWSDPSLSFVLMVGDTDLTPIHQGNGGGNSQVTDNWFVCLDGPDYLPDAAISRISTRSAAETSDVVDKLTTYERATFASNTWIKRAGFIGTSDSGHIGMIEDTHDYCIDTWYTPNDFEPTTWSHGYASSDRHYNSYDADTSEIAASIDEGRTVINYSGHGSETSWQGPTSHGDYDQSDVRNNTNDGMYPFVISNACVTGTLDRTECFGETWQKVPHKGAIAFLGASNSSYWDEDDYFQRRLHAHIFPIDDTPAIGIINNRAKMDLYDHYGDTGTVAYYFDMYNMLSEPSLSLWTRHPRALDVEYDEQIPAGSTELTVTVNRSGTPVEGELVAVRKEDEGIFAAGYTDSSGVVTLPLDPPPQSPGSMDVTVTGHDDQPFEGTCEVVPADGPWLRLEGHSVDDSQSGCDEDGLPDIGETTLFTVTLKNIGSDPAQNTQVRLESGSDVAVLKNPVEIGSVPAGETADAVFQVRIGAGVSCQEQGLFTVSWDCLDCDPGDDSFNQDMEEDYRTDVESQDFEAGGAEPEGWSHEALAGADDWQMTSSDQHGGSWGYFSSGTAIQKEVVLLSQQLHPEGEALLAFWHRYDLTPAKSGAYLEITSDGGETWQNLGPFMTTNPYNAEVGQGLDRHEVWNGDSGGWLRTEADLNSFEGKTVRLRFHLASLGGEGAGWWIDDLRLESSFVGCDLSACGIPLEVQLTRITRDGADTLLEWWDDPVASHYRVRRGNDPSSGDSFEDVTNLDDDDTDALFRDPAEESFACWLIQGEGPDGEGPWGHYGW